MMLISKPIFTQIKTTIPAESKRICFIFKVDICDGDVLCLMGVKDIGALGNKTSMMVEKGEDVKLSADQSSPDSKKVGN